MARTLPLLQVLHCSVPPGHKCELVVDPGPGVLLVLSGAGKALVRAGAVSDELVLDEADLHAGEQDTTHWQCVLRENGLDLTAPFDASTVWCRPMRPAG